MKFLIDECLSPDLTQIAIKSGYPESSHLVHRGMKGWKDHQLMKVILENDWTLVTRNSNDFRPAKGSSSSAPCYLGQELHAGLICLNGPPGFTKEMQSQYFKAALQEISQSADLTNEVIEVWHDKDNPDEVTVERYSFPDDE